MRRMLILMAACGLLFAACGRDEPEPATDAGAGTAQDDQEETEATVELADGDLGRFLVDAEGNTLYMFVPDQKENGTPTCYDDCAEAWPPFEATGEPAAGEGLDPSMLGSVERTDGTDQVTYNDLPLYYFSGDEAPGDTNGQGLNEVWWVVSADGEPITGDDAAKKDKKDDSSAGPGY